MFNLFVVGNSRRTSWTVFAAASLLTALWWVCVFDYPFWRQMHAGKLAELGSHLMPTIYFGALFFCLAIAVICLLSLLPGRLFRILLLLLNLSGAVTFTAAMLYGVLMTPDMVRNFIATDVREAAGYWSFGTLTVFLCAFLPPLAGTYFLHRPASVGRLTAAGVALAALLAAAGLVFGGFQTAATVIRGDRSIRYQVAPYSLIYSGIRTLTKDESPDDPRERIIVDSNPVMTVRPEKPVLFVVVIGETTRSASWGLAGYGRDTTPELRKENVLNFPEVEACGTSTDVSLPCMLSRVGRSDYSRKRILAEESLPALLARAGFDVSWIDNQAGCKGTCEGVRKAPPEKTAALCGKSGCYDEVLIAETRKALAEAKPGRPAVLFLHMMGQHGPAYWERTPEHLKVWGPECRSADLSRCTSESIAAAYDNSVRYTDRVLADLIRTLKSRTEADTALVFVSDHGESLGEEGLYLHGAPFLIAPGVQKTVPMVMWFSEGFAGDFSIDRVALRERAAKGGITHEHLFSTVLGLLRVKSSAARRAFDLTARRP